MGKSNRKLELRVRVPDEKHMGYFNAALNIANGFRVAAKQPVISLETFILNAMITGSNAIHQEYAAYMAKQQSAVKVVEPSPLSEEEKTEAVE